LNIANLPGHPADALAVMEPWLTAPGRRHTIRRMAVQSPAIGALLGHYRILEQIGQGGVGVVFRARDERLERDLAVKILPPGTFPAKTQGSGFIARRVCWRD